MPSPAAEGILIPVAPVEESAPSPAAGISRPATEAGRLKAEPSPAAEEILGRKSPSQCGAEPDPAAEGIAVPKPAAEARYTRGQRARKGGDSPDRLSRRSRLDWCLRLGAEHGRVVAAAQLAGVLAKTLRIRAAGGVVPTETDFTQLGALGWRCRSGWQRSVGGGDACSAQGSGGEVVLVCRVVAE